MDQQVLKSAQRPDLIEEPSTACVQFFTTWFSPKLLSFIGIVNIINLQYTLRSGKIRHPRSLDLLRKYQGQPNLCSTLLFHWEEDFLDLLCIYIQRAPRMTGGFQVDHSHWGNLALEYTDHIYLLSNRLGIDRMLLIESHHYYSANIETQAFNNCYFSWFSFVYMVYRRLTEFGQG